MPAGQGDLKACACRLDYYRGNLEELDEVVADTEEDDGDDVAQTVHHVALGEGEADGHEPLRGHGHHAVHAARQGDVDDRDHVGRDEGRDPDHVVLGQQRQGVLHEQAGLAMKT